MSGSYNEFVHRQNLEKFRSQLASASDKTERKLLRKLLVEEECKVQWSNGGADDRREPDDE